jgi:hypothetical protein
LLMGFAAMPGLLVLFELCGRRRGDATFIPNSLQESGARG